MDLPNARMSTPHNSQPALCKSPGTIPKLLLLRCIRRRFNIAGSIAASIEDRRYCDILALVQLTQNTGSDCLYGHIVLGTVRTIINCDDLARKIEVGNAAGKHKRAARPGKQCHFA